MNAALPLAPPRRFGFLAHLLDVSSLACFDPALSGFSESQLQALLDSWQGLIRPAVVGRTTVQSPRGPVLEGEFIALLMTAKQMLTLDRNEVLAQLQEAVDLSVGNGAEIIGLGGYTSVVSHGGRLLDSGGVPMTTGNSYTAATAIQAVEKAVALRSRRLADCCVCVVGAAGSIGAALCQAIGAKVGSLLLVGNPANAAQSALRLQGLAARIIDTVANSAGTDDAGLAGAVARALREGRSAQETVQHLIDERRLACSTSLADTLPRADVVIACTSSPDVLISSDMVKHGAILCDLSVPHNLPASFPAERPDVLMFDGGVLRVPGSPDLGWRFGLEKGQAFACMCETMLIGMEPHRLGRCAGPVVNVQNIELLSTFGRHHGFELEDFRCFGETVRVNG